MKEFRNKEISELRIKGYSLAKIGKIYNLSRERVRQILSELGIQKPQLEKVKISYNEKIRQRIINSIKETENTCWLWEKAKTSLGYGTMSYKGHKQYAHRVSYQVFKNQPLQNSGVITEETICVLHKCRNRNCVNPDHLYLGTQEDNAKDRSLDKRNIMR